MEAHLVGVNDDSPHLQHLPVSCRLGLSGDGPILELSRVHPELPPQTKDTSATQKMPRDLGAVGQPLVPVYLQ